MQSTLSQKTINKKLNLRLILVVGFLVLVLIGSLIAMWLIRSNSQGALVAYIYQDGELIHEIPLDLVTEPYTIEIYEDQITEPGDAPSSDASLHHANASDTTAKSPQTNGSFNQIEVRPGSIGMINANCPDKLCVHMGFQDSAMVPITCLPNKVVIQLRIEGNSDNKLDGISH